MPLPDPLEAWRRCSGRPMILDVDPARCRILDLVGFSCARGAANPFVETIEAFLNGSATDYERSPLCAYYDAFRPSRICDLWGWDPATCSPQLRGPALQSAAPWDMDVGPRLAEIRRRASSRDHAEHGAAQIDDDGWVDFGPVSDAKGRLEFRRLTAVTRSIRAHGYCSPERTPDNIRGRLLIDGERAVAWVSSGHHRMAALAALGRAPAPIYFYKAAVLRDGVDDWPGVRSGAFTRDQALAVFDCVLEGRRPPWPGCDGWSPVMSSAAGTPASRGCEGQGQLAS